MKAAGLFHEQFERWARRVRARLVIRRMLSGAAIGLSSGAVSAALLWWLREGELRPWTAVLGLLGTAVGLGVAARQRWSDTDVALYLDAKLGSDEALSTAVELRTEAERDDPARAIVVQQAADALENADPKGARPRVLKWVHGLLPVGGAALAWVSMIPLPPPPIEPPPPPGAELVQTANLKGLEKIVGLDQLEARDPEQQKRLKEISERAKKLREKLAEGMPKREALAEVAKLRDAISAEKLNFGDQKNRRGLEAAIGKLQNLGSKRAAEALGDGDLTEFDKEMQKLANQAEEESREEAKKALEEAAEAARKEGAEDLAKALEEQKELFERREARAEALRELAEALEGKLDEGAKQDLKDFGESGSPEARQRLAESLNEALEGLTEEERKRVAERLGESAQNPGGINPMTREQLEDMAKKLGTPEGQKELAEKLKELAQENPGGEPQRQEGLDDAERGGADAQKGLGAVPVPMPGQGGKPNPGGSPPGKPGEGKPGGSGSKKDEGTGNHEGHSDAIDGKGLRAKANPRLDKSVPMLGATRGRTASRPGETANQKGVGALGRAAPSEVGGVERSEVPEEYREHVGRYFQP